MPIEFGLILACVGFTTASVLCAKAIFNKSSLNSKLLFSIALIGIVLQLVVAKEVLFLSGELHLSLAFMCLLISAAINVVLTIRSFRLLNTLMLLVSYGFSALLALSLVFVPLSSFAYIGGSIDSSMPMVVHILLSISAYCVLIIASLYAIQFRYIDAKLKAKTLSLHSHLPPLNLVEAQQFRLMAIGLILLSLALLTGFTFLDNMFSKQYAHKTILSIIAWGIFLVLAVGHKLYGWRGHKSAIGTIFAAFILTLAYFGSRFVREILLY